jgi:Leucine-rich repeat (LRR) protein
MEIIHIFQNLGLISLYKLQLQYNHIGTIDLHAFSGLIEVRILDLSYNHLDYVLPATFEDTPQLRSLYLQGNRLKIYPGPILIIPALQVNFTFHVCIIIASIIHPMKGKSRALLVACFLLFVPLKHV